MTSKKIGLYKQFFNKDITNNQQIFWPDSGEEYQFYDEETFINLLYILY